MNRIAKLNIVCVASLLLSAGRAHSIVVRRDTGRAISAAVGVGAGALAWKYLPGPALASKSVWYPDLLDRVYFKKNKSKLTALISMLMSAAIAHKVLQWTVEVPETQLEQAQMIFDQVEKNLLTTTNYDDSERLEAVHALYETGHTADFMRAKSEAEALQTELAKAFALVGRARTNASYDQDFVEKCNQECQRGERLYRNLQLIIDAMHNQIMS